MFEIAISITQTMPPIRQQQRRTDGGDEIGGERMDARRPPEARRDTRQDARRASSGARRLEPGARGRRST